MKRKGAAPFIKRAERYLKSARLLLKEGDYESCVSRVRFGFEYIESLLMASGRKIIVVDNTEMKDDLVQDMIDVLTSFCARLYGRRSAKNRAKKAIQAIDNAD